MILEFEVENYRSIKERQVFSMVAESSKSKPNNVFEHQLANGETVRLLKAAVIYGANASGKSNLLKAFASLRDFVLAKLSVNDLIEFYDPFLFNTESADLPTTFVLTFIGINNHKFRYEISFNKEEVFKENLDYYPKGKPQNLFKRPIQETKNNAIHIAKLGQIRNHKELKVFKNQLVLSKFGFDTPDSFFLPIYQYFDKKNLLIFNSGLSYDFNPLKKAVSEVLSNNKESLNIIRKLISIFDTKINDVQILKNSNNKEIEYEIFGLHSIYDTQKRNRGNSYLSFEEESKGSNILVILGVLIITKLKFGGVLLIDEIDTSLHPKLAKTLIQLFQLLIANPKNAQIIFSTHETAFLDKDLFRKDQIWFTEKNDYGETELFSVQDFDKVREDTPFDKWYMAGKFGGIPDIQEIEAIFSNGKAK